MHVITYTDAREFQTRVWPLLLENEAENNLMLGIVGRLAQGAASANVGDVNQPLFWAIEDNQRVIAAAIVTPPHRLVLTRAVPEAVDALCDHLHRSGVDLPGAMGPKDAVERFGTRWCDMRGHTLMMSHSLCAYQLDRVRLASEVPGRLDVAGLDEVDLLLGWAEGFARDVNFPHPPTRESVLQSIVARRRFVWRNPLPVSMAAQDLTPNGIRISGVYTPSEHRRHGYATALVAALSQRQLDAGRRFCFLFTDLANPTSNSIYQRIGYQPVSLFGEYDFLPKGETTGT